MTMELWLKTLGWCSLVNLGLLAVWFSIFICAHDWVHRFHSRWFKLSVETFDTAHYCFMGIFKIAILFLNIIPYLVLRIVL